MVGDVIWAPESKTAVAAQQPLIFGTFGSNVVFKY